MSYSFADAKASKMGVPQLGSGKGRICNTLGSSIQNWDDEFVQVLRGKTSSIKPIVVIKCLAFLLPIIVFFVREKVREKVPRGRLSQASSARTTF